MASVASAASAMATPKIGHRATTTRRGSTAPPRASARVLARVVRPARAPVLRRPSPQRATEAILPARLPAPTRRGSIAATSAVAPAASMRTAAFSRASLARRVATPGFRREMERSASLHRSAPLRSRSNRAVRPARPLLTPRAAASDKDVAANAGAKEPGSSSTSRWSSVVNSLATVMEPAAVESLLDEELPAHDEITRGVLPNGLRYVVLPNKVPSDRFEAHLEMHVGSVDEREDEQGLAHLVDHVTFLGSKKRDAWLGSGTR